MVRGRRNTTGRPLARKAAKYTILNVTEPAELMDFIMKKMSGISRNKVKSLLTNRVVLVDNVITTQYNFALKPGMKVQISKAKNNHEFKHQMLKLVYEDAYIIVVEKKEGLNGHLILIHFGTHDDRTDKFYKGYMEKMIKTLKRKGYVFTPLREAVGY